MSSSLLPNDAPSPILPLPSELIDQIAAGEVVERPSSVVKELVENALDAGATNVAVDLTEGGLNAIVVTDDGRGMDECDLRQAIVRHATSKMRVLSDLDCIATYGFRGEALSSIASVSRLSITTRARGADVGLRLTVEGGQRVALQKAGCPVGTSVAIQDLFFNTPARRKFLRAAATEQAHVWEALLKVALGRRAGGFMLSSGARTLLDVPRHSAPHERPSLAFGRRQRRLAPFAALPGPIRVSGFLAEPRQSRRDNSCVWIFVNGRPVRDRSLQRAAVSGYQTALGEAMGTMLVFVDVDAHSVDVNVHPQKWEVRFGDAHAVYATVERAVALAASQLHAEPGVAVAAPRMRPVAAPAAAYARTTRVTNTSDKAQAPRFAAKRPTAVAEPMPAAPPQPQPQVRSAWGALRPLAHAPRGRLACEGPDQSLILVDLCAARRAIAWHRLEQHMRRGAADLPSAALLLPPSWSPRGDELQLAEALHTAQSAVQGRRLGLTLERLGPDRFAVCRWPTLWREASVLAVVRALASTPLAPEPLNAASKEVTCKWLAQMHQAIGKLEGWPEDAQAAPQPWAADLLRELEQQETALDAHTTETLVR